MLLFCRRLQARVLARVRFEFRKASSSAASALHNPSRQPDHSRSSNEGGRGACGVQGPAAGPTPCASTRQSHALCGTEDNTSRQPQLRGRRSHNNSSNSLEYLPSQPFHQPLKRRPKQLQIIREIISTREPEHVKS